MKRFVRARSRVTVLWCAVFILVAGSLWQPGSAVAYGVLDNVPYEEQAGIEEAIQRLYQGPPSVNIYATVARFDTAENAALAMEVLDAWLVPALVTWYDGDVPEPVEDATSIPNAHAWFTKVDIDSDTEPYAEVALIQAQDDVFLYTVYVSNDYAGEVDEVALEAAAAMTEAIAATPIGEATPGTFDQEARSGTWAKLPAQEHEVPQRYGVTSVSETVYVSSPPIPEEVQAVYGSEGLDDVVARGYELGEERFGAIEVALFDDPAVAEAGFANVGPAQIIAMGLEDAGFAETTASVSADEVIAYTTQIEVEGVPVAGALIVARSGPYVVTVAVVARGEQDALAFTEDLAQAVIDAEAGPGDPGYVCWGMSTGGIWDKVPLAGSEVLGGLVTTQDDQVYPHEDGCA